MDPESKEPNEERRMVWRSSRGREKKVVVVVVVVV